METSNTNTIYNELSERIFHSEKFKSYNHLLKNEVLKSLCLDGVDIDELSLEEIQFLLKTASIFACSSSDQYKQIAYSITIILYSQYRNIYDEVAKISLLLLVRLGNFPAYTLVQRNIDNQADILADVPISLQLETINKSIDNKIEISQQDLYLTDFQKELYESLNNGDDFSFAAPTSAGKSFLLILYIIEQLKRVGKINIVYVVPTKALINQVKNDLKANFGKFSIQDVRVLSSTVSFEFEDIHQEMKQDKHVLILTQERLSHLLSKPELGLDIDVLIVDEAQKINDGNRGIILERVIMQTIEKYPNLKVVFSSPLASNPEFFEKYKSTIKNTRTNYSPVHQNIIFVNTNKKKTFLSLLNESSLPLIEKSDLQKDCPKTSNKSKLAFWAYHLGKNQSNILYANGAADTEELSKELCTYLPDVTHEKIDSFIEFIEGNIHKDYSLIHCLKKGVVFHYSTMPREIKEKIEDLFGDESVPVNYLCCTSTLLEGMNLPAKNVFIQKPTKGKGTKMGKFDFWNLAGRAGRLLKDFYGNIYCVDVDDWGEEGYKPEKSIENYEIVSATEDSLINKNKDLSVYLENIKEAFPAKEKELLEQTTSTFVLGYMDNNANTVEKFVKERKLIELTDNISKIDVSIQQIIARNQLPKELLKKNSSIDPRLQNELYAHFISSFYIVLLPKHPAAGQEFYNSLLSIYQTIDRIFFNESDKNIIRRYAVLSSQWMNEYPLGMLIQKQIEYEIEENKFKSVNKCVRDIVDVIERTLTYKYAKYLKCYYDILLYHLEKIKIQTSVMNLSAYLELGAYHRTTLSLLSFGLSRTTAIRLKNIIGNNDLGRLECKKWLDENFAKQVNKLPLVCQEDFEKNFE